MPPAVEVAHDAAPAGEPPAKRQRTTRVAAAARTVADVDLDEEGERGLYWPSGPTLVATEQVNTLVPDGSKGVWLGACNGVWGNFKETLVDSVRKLDVYPMGGGSPTTLATATLSMRVSASLDSSCMPPHCQGPPSSHRLFA